MWSLHVTTRTPASDPLAHPHKGTLAGVGDDFEAVHEGLHDGKAHAAAFLLRLGGIKGFHGLRNIGEYPCRDPRFPRLFHRVRHSWRAEVISPRVAFIAVDDGVGYSLGDGGFQVGDLAEGRTELHGEGRDSDPGEGLVLRKGRKSEAPYDCVS